MRQAVRGRNPYVGPRPYEAGEEDLFFGRDHEAEELASLILANPITLFFSESGAGKTSLLRARLIPHLKREHMDVFPVARVGGPTPRKTKASQIANIFAFNTLMCWAPAKPHRTLVSLPLQSFLGSRPRHTDEAGDPRLRVAILDQLEELFSRHLDRWGDRAGFFKQLALALTADPALRVVFAIREDFLGRLEPFSLLLPGRLRARFQMERLREGAALLAVTGPLRRSGRSFAPGVAERLVEELLYTRVESDSGDTVKVKGDVVEPVQLQVVCQRLWQSLPTRVRKISEKHRQKFGNVDQALSSFYEDAIAQACKVSEVHPHHLREWCGTELVTSTGTRGFAHRGPESTAGIPNTAVEALEGFHLIRSEWRAGARWYELTHDRFIGPIQVSNEQWCRDRDKTLTQVLGKLRKAEQLARRGRYADAVDSAEGAFRLSADAGDLGSVLFALSLLGTLHAACKHYDAALEAYERLYSLAERHECRDDAMASLLAIGQVLREMGRPEDSATLFGRYIERNPGDAAGYAERARAYLELGRHRQALRDYRRAIRLEPENAVLYSDLGNLYRSLEKTNKAIAAYQEAIRLDNTLGSPHYGLGIVYASVGRIEDAQREYEVAIQLDPEDAYSHEGLGDLYARIGRTEEAIAFFRRAIAIDPTDLFAHVSLAYVYRDLGRQDEALASFRRAIELNPQESSTYVGLGGTYRRMDRFEEAAAAYERAIELDPGNVLARASEAVCYRRLGREDDYHELANRARRDATPEWAADAGEYNEACFRALVGDADTALRCLRTALEKQQQTPGFAWRDIDFDSIRDDPRFGALAGKPSQTL